MQQAEETDPELADITIQPLAFNHRSMRAVSLKPM